MKIGYFLPEFPGQTHIFFWRELKILRQLGVTADVVSTRKPERSIICHAWSDEAMRETVYLFPLRAGDVWRSAVDVFRAGRARWSKCLDAISTVRELNVRGKLRMFGLVLMGARLAQLARERGWQHIHAHSCADVAFVAMFAHLLFDIPYSLTLHGPLSYFGPGQRVKWRYASFAIVITEVLKREVAMQLPDFPQSRIDVAPMGVDVKTFTRRKPYSPPERDGVLKLVSCGRLHEGKGHQDLFEAVALMRQRGVNLRLLVLGEGPARTMLEDTIAALGLRDAVELKGAVSEEGVRDALEEAHIFVLGSREEGIGVATMEAMALEVPVIVTGVGGVPELVRDGIDGRLVRPRDPEGMANTIQSVAADPRITEFGKAGRQRIIEKFSSDVSARALAKRLLGATAR